MFKVYLHKQNTSHLTRFPLSPLPLLPPPLLPHPLHVTEILSNHLPLIARINPRQMITQVIVNFIEMFQGHGPPTLPVRPDAVPVDPGDNPFDQGLQQHFHTLWLRLSRTMAVFCPDHGQQKQLKEGSHALSCQATPGLFSSFVHTFGLTFHMSSLSWHSRSQTLLSTYVHLTD